MQDNNVVTIAMVTYCTLLTKEQELPIESVASRVTSMRMLTPSTCAVQNARSDTCPAQNTTVQMVRELGIPVTAQKWKFLLLQIGPIPLPLTTQLPYHGGGRVRLFLFLLKKHFLTCKLPVLVWTSVPFFSSFWLIGLQSQ